MISPCQQGNPLGMKGFSMGGVDNWRVGHLGKIPRCIQVKLAKWSWITAPTSTTTVSKILSFNRSQPDFEGFLWVLSSPPFTKATHTSVSIKVGCHCCFYMISWTQDILKWSACYSFFQICEIVLLHPTESLILFTKNNPWGAYFIEFF